jgi:hypothetical protein
MKILIREKDHIKLDFSGYDKHIVEGILNMLIEEHPQLNTTLTSEGEELIFNFEGPNAQEILFNFLSKMSAETTEEREEAQK